MIPPVLMCLRLPRCPVPLILPLVLLWPLLLVAIPLIELAALRKGGLHPGAGLATCRTLCHLRRLQVDIASSQHHLQVHVW